MIEAIAAHKAAWQAFQVAPDGDLEHAAAVDTDALINLMSTTPVDRADLDALVTHLRWYIVEQAERAGMNEVENLPFAFMAALTLAAETSHAHAREGDVG